MQTFEGQGKYGQECDNVLIQTEAQAVLMQVIGGTKGHGFSVSAKNHRIVLLMPKILRDMADEIEKEIEQAAQQ